MAKKTGAERISAERTRQIEVEKWAIEHDDHHDKGEMAFAAACFAAPHRIFVEDRRAIGVMFRDPWPWDDTWDKRPHPSSGNFPEPEKATDAERIDLLTKAGALCAAEIDRLLRKKSKPA